MATKIVTKNSSTASAVPTTGDLVQGELAVNVADKRLFTEDNAGAIVELGTNPSTIDINAGAIDGTTIGASSASTGAFTTLTATGIDVTGTATMDGLTTSLGIDVNGTDDLRVRFLNGGSFKGGAQVATTSGDMITGSAVDDLAIRSQSNMLFATGGSTERMRIDSSGNVLVGTTDTTPYDNTSGNGILLGDGLISSAQSGGNAAIFNRMTSDGSIVQLRKDGTTVGSIGVHSSSLQIGTSNTQIKFSDAEDSFYVVNSAGVARDNSHDLGKTGARFKNLYLSGGVYANNASGAFLWNAENSHIAFGTNNTERMRIDSSGRVGISTSDPKSSLEVKGTFGAPATSGSAAGFISRFSQTSGVGSLDFGFGDPYSWIQSRASNNYATNFDLALQPNGGNVGIGCTPASKLDIDISTNARGSFSSSIGEVGSGNFALQVTNSAGSALKPLGFRAEDIRFATGSSERMRIDSSGAISVGSSTQAVTELQLNHENTGGKGEIQLNSHGTASFSMLSNFTGGTVSGVATGGFGLITPHNYPISIVTNDLERLRVSNSGNLLVGGTADRGGKICVGGTSSTARILPQTDNVGYIGQSDFRWQAVYAINGTIQTSDEREKTAIKPTTLGLEFIKDLRPVSYKWIDGEQQNKGKDEREHQGLIAQQVAETVEKHGIDKNLFGGLDIQKTSKYEDSHGMTYDQLIAPLIKAIQEQQTLIESLTARIAALEE